MKPVVSIGMPAFNEARHIGEAINSLLSQSHRDIELIISDNASTDGTYEIISSYAALDTRIRAFRNSRNVGALHNFEYVRDHACGEYFMWAGAHDRWHPLFISRMLDVLTRDPGVILAYPLTMLIDANGRELGVKADRMDTGGLAAIDRFTKFVMEVGDCDMFHGLIRRRAVADIRYKPVLGPDTLLLAELSLRGCFVQIEEVLFYRREVRNEVYGSDEYRRRLWKSMDPARARSNSSRSMNAMVRGLRNELIMLVFRSPALDVRARLTAIDAIVARFGTLGPFAAKYFSAGMRCLQRLSDKWWKLQM
jgi:glycosyltransferase involved in cell wall biosynthesis